MMPRYKLRTLLIVLALGPPVLGIAWTVVACVTGITGAEIRSEASPFGFGGDIHYRRGPFGMSKEAKAQRAYRRQLEFSP